MARCITYKRPSNWREDAFPIGSIKSGAQKLQIHWGNTKQRNQLNRKVNEKQNKKRSREEHDNNLDSLQLKSKKIKAEKYIKFNESFHFARKEFSDHLERSDLSEEHDPPALLLNKCNSKGFQNSQNGNAAMGSDPKKQKPGLVIRIKLPLKKKKDPEPESASINPSCSQAFLTDSTLSSSELTKFSKEKSVSTRRSSFLQVTKPSESREVLTESGLRTKETIAQPSISGPFSTPHILHESFVQANVSEYRHRQRSERKLFRDLIVNWKPPSIQLIEEDEDEEEDEIDWLFATNKSQDAKPRAQSCKDGVSNPSNYPGSASSLQPRATYLPEFNMYQMPYVIPF